MRGEVEGSKRVTVRWLAMLWRWGISGGDDG